MCIRDRDRTLVLLYNSITRIADLETAVFVNGEFEIEARVRSLLHVGGQAFRRIPLSAGRSREVQLPDIADSRSAADDVQGRRRTSFASAVINNGNLRVQG